MFLPKYPYTDMHELNLDWLLSVVLRMQNLIDSGLAEYFESQLGNLFLTSSYNSDTETLNFTIKES